MANELPPIDRKRLIALLDELEQDQLSGEIIDTTKMFVTLTATLRYLVERTPETNAPRRARRRGGDPVLRAGGP